MSYSYKCGVDQVDIARVRKLVDHSTTEVLMGIFSREELDYAGESQSRYGRLAARFAAKEACLKLFPVETAVGSIDLSDFSVQNDGYGAPQIRLSTRANCLRYLYGFDHISISLSHTKDHAIAMAIAARKDFNSPLVGKLIYYFLPFRRNFVVKNLDKVYGKTLKRAQIKSLAQSYYASLAKSFLDFIHFQFLSKARQIEQVRVEHGELIIEALSKGRGAIILTGYFANITTTFTTGANHLPEIKGRVYFAYIPFKPAWLVSSICKKLESFGFKSFPKIIREESILNCLQAGNAIIFPFDNHNGCKNSNQVDFFSHPAETYSTLASIAITSGCPVIPVSSWRDENGKYVLHFEKPLHLIESTNAMEKIRLNTHLFNDSLERLVLRHPEKWRWMQRLLRTSKD